MPVRAVTFDLGGVVIGSPLHAIVAYERELRLDPNAVNHTVIRSGPTGAWSRLERGELELEEFYPLFESDCRTLGVVIDAREMMRRAAEIAVPRPAMLEAIRRLRARRLAGGRAHQQLDHRGRRDGALKSTGVTNEDVRSEKFSGY